MLLDFYTPTNLVPVLATPTLCSIPRINRVSSLTLYCFIPFQATSAKLIVLFSGSKEPFFANTSLPCSIEVFFAAEECPLLLLFITVVALSLLLLVAAVVGSIEITRYSSNI